MKDKLNYKLLNILIIAAILYIALITKSYWGGVISKVFSICLPFIIAFVIAYVLYPFVKKLEKRGVRHNLAVTCVVLIVTAIIIIIGFITLPVIYNQLISFTDYIVEVIGDFGKKFDINLGGFSKTINNSLNDMIANIGKYVSDGTLDLLNKSISFVTNTIVVYIVSIYFLADMDSIRKKMKKILKRFKNKSLQFVRLLDDEMENYFHGLALFMLVQLIEYSLLFFIVGHPNWALLGLLACVTTVIPYFGGLITNIIAVITASVISTPLFISTLVITLIFPNIDGYIISPKIYGKTNNVNPVIAIFAVAAGGALFGFIGIVISLPAYIILKCTWDFFDDDIKEKFIDSKDNRD